MDRRIAFKYGDRSKATGNAFVQDVAARMKNRVQISTNGLGALATCWRWQHDSK